MVLGLGVVVLMTRFLHILVSRRGRERPRLIAMTVAWMGLAKVFLLADLMKRTAIMLKNNTMMV